jgi:hypothetical protein
MLQNSWWAPWVSIPAPEDSQSKNSVDFVGYSFSSKGISIRDFSIARIKRPMRADHSARVRWSYGGNEVVLLEIEEGTNG